MIAYASRTGTRRNLDAMRAVNTALGFDFWRLLVSRAGVWRTEGFRYCLDNGAWSDFQAGGAFDDEAFDGLLERLGGGADWVVLPDIVAGGRTSLDLSLRWMNRAMAMCDLVLIAVQDGMDPADLAPYVGPRVGIFLGGSTDWKLARMALWGAACADWGCWYHVARVNTARRFRMAHDAGATSIDGSSATRFAKTLPLLEAARRQPSLLSPRRRAA
jgi:hypothetical protein